MKTKTYKTADGREGTKYTLESGDIVTSRFTEPRITINDGKDGKKITNYSLGVTTPTGQEVYIQLTQTQGKKLQKVGDLQGKKIVAYSYANNWGSQVGVKVA